MTYTLPIARVTSSVDDNGDDYGRRLWSTIMVDDYVSHLNATLNRHTYSVTLK